jgi:hypothetical protein
MAVFWCVQGPRLLGNTRLQFHHHEAVQEIAV